jgi:hypothetical protein
MIVGMDATFISKVMAMVAEIADLQSTREAIDGRINARVTDLITFINGQSTATQKAVLSQVNGSAGHQTRPQPPADSLQGRIYTWLRGQAGPTSRADVASGIGHPERATESTLRAMQTKGLVRHLGRDRWQAII